MRGLVSAILWISLSALSALHAEPWTIHWEAAKGPLTATIDSQPRPLADYLFALPSGHPEADADRRAGLEPRLATVRVIGLAGKRKVVSVELEVPDAYYQRYFLVLAEAGPARFVPVYVHQYAPDAHGVGKPDFRETADGFELTVRSLTHGTTPSAVTHRITYDFRNPPRTKSVR